jgi:hypothetical protein
MPLSSLKCELEGPDLCLRGACRNSLYNLLRRAKYLKLISYEIATLLLSEYLNMYMIGMLNLPNNII